MKVIHKVSKYTTIEVEGNDIKEIWRQLGQASEPLKAEPCGLCQNEATRIVSRQNGKFTYHERHCDNCFARLSYGQNEGLYPRRRYHEDHPAVKEGKAKEGDRIPDGGWEKYVAPKKAA